MQREIVCPFLSRRKLRLSRLEIRPRPRCGRKPESETFARRWFRDLRPPPDALVPIQALRFSFASLLTSPGLSRSYRVTLTGDKRVERERERERRNSVRKTEWGLDVSTIEHLWTFRRYFKQTVCKSINHVLMHLFALDSFAHLENCTLYQWRRITLYSLRLYRSSRELCWFIGHPMLYLEFPNKTWFAV